MAYNKEYSKEYYNKNREKIQKWIKKYAKKNEKTLKRIQSRRATSLRMLKKYPKKWKARRVVFLALHSGKIKRLPCKICGEKKSQGHHDDYDKPLKLTWLCKKHHCELHRIIKLKNHD
jgi:hypothetical protein